MKIRKKRKKWILALLAIVLILLARAVPAGAAGKEPEPDGQEEKQLVITVVEDIPAEDLEEIPCRSQHRRHSAGTRL